MRELDVYRCMCKEAVCMCREAVCMFRCVTYTCVPVRWKAGSCLVCDEYAKNGGDTF